METLQDPHLSMQLQAKSDRMNGLPDLAALVAIRDDLESRIARAERCRDRGKLYKSLRVKHDVDQDINHRYTALVTDGSCS